MIKIITSNTSNAVMNAVIDEIRKNDHTCGHHVVIVPDTHALSAEKVVFERLDIKGSMTIEVVSFLRLIKKVLGRGVRHTLSKQGAVIFFQKVIERNREKLIHYKKVALTEGFSGEMYAVIASIRNNGISIRDFEEATLKLSGTTLNKAKDILLLYKEYVSSLGDYFDGTTRLEAFIDAMPTSKKVTDSYFYLYGFDSLSEKQIDIITSLAKYSKGVAIGLMRSNNGANHNIYPYEVIERLITALEIKKLSYTMDEGRFERLKTPFNVLHTNLFALNDGKIEDRNHAVTLFKERDNYEQYNAVCREIIRLVRRESYRFQDITVIDCEGSPDFKEILVRYGIPHFLDEKRPLSSSLIFKYMSGVLDVARYGFRIDKVRALIKNPLFASDKEMVAKFENYILKYNLSFNDYEKEIEDEWCEFLRKKLIETVEPFKYEQSVAQFVQSFKKLISTDEHNLLWNLAFETAKSEIKTYNQQAYDRFKELLDEYVSLLGNETETPLGFKRMITESCSAESISLIPHYLDAVYVGALRESCIIKSRAIFVIGATANLLPKQDGYKAIISSLDQEKLLESGVRLYPTPLDRIREERFNFIDLLSKTDKLYVGYPENGYDATQNKPSEVIKEIGRITGNKVISINARFNVEKAKNIEEIEDAVGSKANAFYTYLLGGGLDARRSANLDSVYLALTDEEKELIVRPVKTTPLVPLTYTFGGDRHTKVTQLEQYFSCPYKHFMQFGLKLNEREEGKLRVTDVGTIIHEVLECYFKATLGKLRKLSVEELGDVAERSIEKVFSKKEYEYLRADTSVDFLLKRLKAESRDALKGLTKNVLQGNFTPKHIELAFDTSARGSRPLSFKSANGEVSFHGKIDRVDTFKSGERELVVVMDYKTGSIKPKLSSIYYGEKIQLYLYLLALKENFGYVPVGAFYVPVKSGYSKDRAKAFRMEGQFVASEEIITAFDRDVMANLALTGEATESNVVNVKVAYDRNGEFKIDGKKSTYGEKDLEKILCYLEKVIPIAIDEIEEGYIAKSPFDKGCDYCAYKNVCGGATEGLVRAKVESRTPLDVEDLLEGRG